MFVLHHHFQFFASPRDSRGTPNVPVRQIEESEELIQGVTLKEKVAK